MAQQFKPLTSYGELEHYEIDANSDMTALPDHDDWVRKYLYLKRQFDYVPPLEFYRDIFPKGFLERLGHQEDKKPNGLLTKLEEVERDGERKTVGRRLVLTDGLEQITPELLRNTVLCAPISYYGRSTKASHALFMHALTLDIDYVGLTELSRLVYWFADVDVIPRPTYIVNSGHGVHLYYVFESPIPMFKNNQKAIVRLKEALVKRIWTDYTSYDVSTIQALGAVQAFRMVGSRSKLKTYALAAFRTGEKVTVDYLNDFVPKENRIDVTEQTRIPLSRAKELYPDWYQRIVVEGQKHKRWHVKRDLYDWYKRRIETEASYGHRYFCMMCLAIYARKCDITREELEMDANYFQKVFNAIKPDMPFTIEETFKALEAYNDDYLTFPRESIQRVTGMEIPPNKRNGRKQEQHMAVMRAIQGVTDPDGNWRYKPPTKESEIKAYAAAHPDANHSEIARALGVSRPTVIKWLKK